MMEAREEGSGFSGLLDFLTPASQDYFSSLATQEKTFEDAREYFLSASHRLKVLKVKNEQRELRERIPTIPEGPNKREALMRFNELNKKGVDLERQTISPTHS
jgi:hypothetical protein